MKHTLAAYDAQRAFAVAMGQDPMEPIGTFFLRSKSRPGCGYEMQHTPDGYAVHQGEGCEGELFNGPIKCWHSRDYSVAREDFEDMTQAVTTYQGGAVAEVREFTPEDVETLKATICKGATDSELRLFIATCKHTGLDPFMRQILAVKRWDSTEKREVMAIQIGIDGFRLTARRTGEMQGMDGPQWTYDGKTWVDLPFEDRPPLAARCAVWRKGSERPFVAVCRWSAYVQMTREGKPNAMWTRMGPEQLAKCAEALALRRAFPAEMAALPSRPDFIDADEVEMERLPWTPSQDAIEGEVVEHDDVLPYADVQADIERDNVGEPNPAQQAYEQAETDAVVASNRDADVQAIVAMLTDCKQTWNAREYRALYDELSIFMPDGEAKFDPKVIDGERAAACVAYLKERRGEAVPA